ncbi:MAG: aspartate--tRNA ligase [Blastopirellula sp.]|nr:MAG: aspartate--tRNA ligase [Blastopirellula sp.]
MLRTHTCGQLRAENVGEKVTLCGWVDSYRDHGGGLFVDLRDRYGKTQVVFSPESGAEVQGQSRAIRNEDVIKVIGRIDLRPEGTVNSKLPTGEIEIRVESIEILNKCKTPPFFPNQQDQPNEDLRLANRFLDLRGNKMQETLVLRSRIIKLMRDYFEKHDFIDVETPILGRSTPEGARDYLVPSRVHHGTFYALPQSPQLYKQIMMIAGYDRYVQVARCFRDEDLRADRQPEFTQLDMEMSFVEMDDIIGMIDGLVEISAKEIHGQEVKLPLPRMTYAEALERFGHDAPDLRFGMELIDCTDLAAEAEFRVFKSVADAGNKVRGIIAKGAASKYSRRLIDNMTKFVQEDFGAKGLAWFKVEEGMKLSSPIAKNFSDELLAKFAERFDAEPGDLILMVADKYEVTCKALYALRKKLGAELELYDPKEMHYSWITEFPMFDYDEDEDRWNAMHHPFTAPLPEDIEKLDTAPHECRAIAYDLVINGSEAGGGTIRIHDSEVQEKVFGLLGMEKEEAQEKFGFLLDALQYGAPPHGGIALGIDRWVMLFGGLDNIRDCIAFPKTQKAADLMTKAPGSVDRKQLEELALKVMRLDEKRV